MSRRSHTNQAGFTLVELSVVMFVSVLLITMFYTFFHSDITNYINLQKDADTEAQLTTQANRVSNVVRGLTGIVSVAANDMVLYGYFYPNDTYVSKVHYYISGGKLLVDVTPMSANPPVGTPLTASTKTYTVVASLYQPNGTNLFAYYGGTNNVLTLPITDLNTIKSIQVNLAARLAVGGNQLQSIQVSLRNRKTNL